MARGVGKSHLLSRLYRWANETADGGDPRACYVYINHILVDPERLPRYLLKYVISRLTEGNRDPLHKSPLYRFVDGAIRHALESAGLATDRIEERLPQAVDAYRAYFVKSGEVRSVYETLFQFWRYARPDKADEPGRRLLASSAVSWLSGDEVDPTLAARLGFKVAADEPAMLRDDREVELVLMALARLAHVSRQPFIVCIDQFETIEPDKIKLLSRFLHTLLDHAANLLVICCGVKQTLLGFKEDEIIPEASWDRIAQYRVELNRITQTDARMVLEARLERFHEPFLEVEAVKTHLHEDTLFPLSRSWLAKQLGDAVELRTRDVLTWARDAWEAEQEHLGRLGGNEWVTRWPHAGTPSQPKPLVPVPDLIDGVVDRKIAEQVSQLRLQPGSLPPDAGNLAGLVESLLDQCKGDGLPYTFRGVERAKGKAGKLPPYDLLVREKRDHDGREVSTGVLFVTNVGLSATAALRRLLEDDKPPDHRLLVTDHERRPLKVGPQGVEYYNDLRKLGTEKFEHLKIDFEQYAALDALRDVVGMARSGDLEIESPPGTPRPVSEPEVIASHNRKDRYRGHPLLRLLLTEGPPPIDDDEKKKTVTLEEKDVRQYVMAQLAWMMGTTALAIAKGYVVVMKAPKVTQEAAWPQVKAIAETMHKEGLVHATPHDDDLFLLLRK